jgi:hypothetical protein
MAEDVTSLALAGRSSPRRRRLFPVLTGRAVRVP